MPVTDRADARAKDPLRWMLLIPVAVMLLLWWTTRDVTPAADPPPEDHVGALRRVDVDAMGDAVRNAFAQESELGSLERLAAPSRGVYVALRHRGRRVGHSWGHGPNTGAALREAMSIARTRAGKRADRADTAEVCLSRAWRGYDYGDPQQRAALTSFELRGLRGLSLRRDDGISAKWSPTFAIASNRSHQRLIELFERSHKLRLAEEAKRWSVETFECDALLVSLREPDTKLLFRGNEVVALAAVDRSAVESLARDGGEWLRRSVHPTGRMTYMYYPSGPSEPNAAKTNNAIRQWMATIALGRYARFDRLQGDPELEALVARNIDYNLETQFERKIVDDEELGYVRMFGKGKLGAAALAALAIAEHPERERWAEQEALLAATIDHLWHPDGSFSTFIEPAGRTDQQNFYPGEALLYWAHRYEEDREPERLARFMRSFHYYRRWHLEPDNRNPAFVPWHTQAYVKVWRVNKDPELRDFVFEMNDWLLGMQQVAPDAPSADVIGRFYDPKRKHFGSPHASSTGVYLEGLIAAWSVAVEEGDQARADRYRAAILLGLRSAMQLQFVDDVDLYYVPDAARARVRGGLRTRVFDNRVRCDNVQHNLMAQLEILARFGPDDW